MRFTTLYQPLEQILGKPLLFHCLVHSPNGEEQKRLNQVNMALL